MAPTPADLDTGNALFATTMADSITLMLGLPMQGIAPA
jgi:hypothetical protein